MISVVVCTYNRPDLVRDVLETLCAQEAGRDQYEVIMVDNAPNEATRAAVARHEHHGNVRYIPEPQPGLSHARNCGWRAARGAYVAYVDDDCTVPPQWITAAQDVIATHAPAVFGGPFYAFYHTPRPRWYRDAYGSYEPYQQARALDNEFLFGGNIFIRRDILEALGGFDTRLGMSGRTIGYGEEIALQLALQARMPEALRYYDPRLKLYHLVRPEKMHLRRMLRDRFAHGRFAYRVFVRNPVSLTRAGLVTAATPLVRKIVRDLTIGLLRYDRQRYPAVQNYLYEQVFEHVAELGKLFERRRITVEGQGTVTALAGQQL